MQVVCINSTIANLWIYATYTIIELKVSEKRIILSKKHRKYLYEWNGSLNDAFPIL